MDRARVAQVTVIGAVITFAACGGGSDERTLPALVDVPETVAIGVLPDPQTDAATLPTPPPPPTTEPVPSSTTPAEVEPIDTPIGGHVSGGRLLMIGDSILASAAAPNNEGLMCDALVLFGWQVAIDAESGRNVDFAHDVLDQRLEDDDWDAIALSFGSEVDGTSADDVSDFESELESVITRVSPRPTLLFTLAETDEARAVVNDVIRRMPERYPNVVIVEFADAGADGVAVLDRTGSTLTEDGINRLSIRTAAAVGPAPGDSEGECLPSEFVDQAGGP